MPSIRQIASKYNVPHDTLSKKVKYPDTDGAEPAPRISSQFENKIIKCLLALAEAGFPFTREQLFDSIEHLLNQLGRTNVFGNSNRPENHWFFHFQKRNPSLAIRFSQNITQARAKVTETDLRNWFESVRQRCVSVGIQEVLNDPNRMFNLDVMAFFTSTNPGKVVALRRAKTIYNAIKTNDKDKFNTCLIGANAAGNLAPPVIVFKGKRLPGELKDTWPGDWGIGKFSYVPYDFVFIFILIFIHIQVKATTVGWKKRRFLII